jgi:hypothetical protein
MSARAQPKIAEKAQYSSPLTTAKVRRREAGTAVEVATIHADADAAEVVACDEHLIKLGRGRAAAIAANKPNAVIAVDAELLRSSVVREIAAARSVSSTEKHGEAVAALRDAEAAVIDCAKRVINEQMVELAREITRGLDALLARGEELRELAMGDGMPIRMDEPSRVPLEVDRALERLSKLINPLNVPLHVLRAGPRIDLWAQRLAQLTAEEQED